MTKILFLHGSGSRPGGQKPSWLQENGHDVINPQLPDESFEESVKIAQQLVDTEDPEIIVGSSRGGAVAMHLNAPNARLVLVCPAWKFYPGPNTVKPGTTILHSQQDEVVPYDHSLELISNSGLPDSALITVGSDHRLADPASLMALLVACQAET
jgi:predicted esterase